MKRLLFILLLLPAQAFAAQLTLTVTWDQYNDPVYSSDVIDHKQDCDINGNPFPLPDVPINNLGFISPVDAIPGDTLFCIFKARVRGTNNMSPGVSVTHLIGDLPIKDPTGHSVSVTTTTTTTTTTVINKG